MQEYVFVYGTLKRKSGLHGLLKSSKYMGNAILSGATLLDTGWGYPGLVYGNKQIHAVHGEVYEVTDALMEILDNAEGVPWLYERKATTVQQADGTIRLVWVYVYLRAIGNEIAVQNGDWRVHNL